MKHIPRLTTNKTALLEGQLTHLRLYLSLAARELRKDSKMTQKELAKRLGVRQAAVSKLEAPHRDHKLESIVRYLAALDAELLVAVKHGNDVFQVSDDDEWAVACFKQEVRIWAEDAGEDLQTYVCKALDCYKHEEHEKHFHTSIMLNVTRERGVRENEVYNLDNSNFVLLKGLHSGYFLENQKLHDRSAKAKKTKS